MDTRSAQGFTIIEVLISTGIIVLMSSLILASLPTFRRQSKTQDAASTILLAAQETRQKSISVKQFQNAIFPSYGLYFDTNFPRRIRIYADCVADDTAPFGLLDDKDNFTFDPASIACGLPNQNGFVEDRTLDSQVSITQLKISGQVVYPPPTVTQAYIEFVRPQPSIWITGITGAGKTLLDYGELEITVKDDIGGNTRTIHLWTSGRMDIQ